MKPWQDSNREPGRVVIPISGIVKGIIKAVRWLKKKAQKRRAVIEVAFFVLTNLGGHGN